MQIYPPTGAIWCKTIVSVDRAQKAGYRLNGSFFGEDGIDVTPGTVILEMDRAKQYHVYRVGVVGGLIEIMSTKDNGKPWSDRVLEHTGVQDALAAWQTSQGLRQIEEDVIKPQTRDRVPFVPPAPEPEPEEIPGPGEIEELPVPAPLPEPQEGKKRHKMFGRVMRLVRAHQNSVKQGKKQINIWLSGPAGCGKTYLCEQIAEELGVPFYGPLIGAQIADVPDITGRKTMVDGTQVYVPSCVVACLQSPIGGVCLLDEIDSVNDPALLGVLHSVLEGQELYVPSLGQVIRCEDPENTVFIAAANTWGRGADADYCGRARLDAAFLDRFACSKIAMDYDESLEMRLFEPSCVRMVQAARKGVRAKKIKQIVSMRSSATLSALYEVGAGAAELLEAFFEGWSEDDMNAVRPIMLSEMGENRP